MMGGCLGKAFEDLKHLAVGPLGKVAFSAAATPATGGMVNPFTASALNAGLGILSGESPTHIVASSAKDYIGSRVPFFENGFFG